MFNDLLVAWLVLKGRELNPDYNVLDWVTRIESYIVADIDPDQSAEEKRDMVARELEGQLITTIVDGRRNGNWPWEN